MYLGCWRAYVVPVVSSTMVWHCIVYSLYSITMQHLCVVVLRPKSLYLYVG